VNVVRNSVRYEEISQHLEHVLGLQPPLHANSQAFARELIDHRELPSSEACF
jgi:hypothetical protein